ncbi:MAG TPA: choice-of-anchor Q domain-containing protein [Solirubrobacteraceae bacterium]|jgi:hypothetical protein|nr:choice-of-anchor Q domain-containing protein [Solirubrobacteraceae bacterium]
MRFGSSPRPRSYPRPAAIVYAVLVAMVAATAGLAASAQAATYTVGTLNDETGTCANPASGACSLRQLINYENSLPATPSPPDTIVVPGGKYGLANGELPITQSLAILGAGARTTNVDVPVGVSGRVFDITIPKGGSTPTVVISGLEISGGTANASNGFFGGDVHNTAQLVLNEDWITGGTASSGGGISNDTGTLVVEHSLVSGNHANTGGGDSGGIQNHGSANCETSCTPGTRAVLSIENSTVTGNDARVGAGIFSWTDNGVADGNVVSVINSTIAYNSTQDESGTCPPATEGCARGPGAGLLVSDGTIDIGSSILAYNSETTGGSFTATNCSTLGSATILSFGYNLETGSDCGFISTGDLQSTNPQFSSGVPQNNGGNTDTLAPKPTSPAVDAIPTSNPFCGGIDQGDVTRPQGAGCDIGAVELVPFTIEDTEGSQFSGQLATAGCSISGTPTINWGDGQTSPATVDATHSLISGTHTYVEEGIFNGSVSYSDDCGSHKVAFLAKVADVPLSATGVPVSATAGVQFSATVATFTDGDPAGTASDYTASISWGDGTTSTATIGSAASGGFAVTGSHTYPGGGTYQTSVAIRDVGGATATATSAANVANPPSGPPTLLTPSPPTVLSTTSAAFTTTVNPHGLAATVHFEYGPSLGGAKAAAITYGSVTPDQSVGADFANHTVTATVTGLLPNVTYHVRAVATNNAGSALGADQTLQTPADPPPPPPVLGKSVNVTPVSGIVYIELPPGAKLASVLPSSPGVEAFAPLTDGRAFAALADGQAFAALTKGLRFIPLTEARQIPVGSTLDTTAGVVSITTATTASRKGKLQSGDFGAGIFKLLQQRRQRGLTELNIIDNHSARQVCATVGKARIAAKQPSNKVLGRLNASSHGRFTARGHYSAATVRGTIWSVANQCDGTLTRVKRGVVSVRDFRRRKTITLFTGQSYLARAFKLG